MLSKIFWTGFLCLAIAELTVEASSGIGKAEKNFVILNERLLSRFPNSNASLTYFRGTCNGNLKKGPTEIEYISDLRFIGHDGTYCKWNIEAPEDSVVYVYKIHYEALLHGYTDPKDKVDDYYGAPALNVYDGTEVDASKRLFKFGERSLNNALSTGNHAVIDVHFRKVKRYAAQKIALQFAFVEKSKVQDLLS